MATNISIDEILEKYVPESERKHIDHILYGVRYDERFVVTTNFI